MTKTHLLPALFLLALGCDSTNNNAVPHDGAAGGSGGGGTSGTLACGDPTLAFDPTALIDDMESPAPLTVLGATTGGSWWAGGDDPSKLKGAGVTPDGSVTAEPIPGGRCGSKYASHVTGHGFDVWSVMNVSFGWNAAAQKLLPFDASFRNGITFWARIGDTSTDQVRLNVTDKYSNDQGGICDMTVFNGDTACYDHFGVVLGQLSTSWRQYRVPFLGLSQLHFGIPRPSVDTSAIYSIDFNFPVDTVFDLWVDDISFF